MQALRKKHVLQWTARKNMLWKEKMLIEWTNLSSQYGSTLHHAQFKHYQVFYPWLGPNTESVGLKNVCFACVCVVPLIMKVVKVGSFRLGARDGVANFFQTNLVQRKNITR